MMKDLINVAIQNVISAGLIVHVMRTPIRVSRQKDLIDLAFYDSLLLTMQALTKEELGIPQVTDTKSYIFEGLRYLEELKQYELPVRLYTYVDSAAKFLNEAIDSLNVYLAHQNDLNPDLKFA